MGSRMARRGSFLAEPVARSIHEVIRVEPRRPAGVKERKAPMGGAFLGWLFARGGTDQ